MIKKISCIDLECPLPVIKTKEALLESPDSLEVKLNSFSSIENVKRLAKNSGYEAILKEKKDGITTILLSKKSKNNINNKPFYVLVISAIVSAFLAGTCCLAPLLFLIFGVSMSSLSFLQIFAPYQTLFSIISVGILLYLWFNYLKRVKNNFMCHSSFCKNYKLYLSIGTLLVLIFVTYPIWANYILEYL